MNKTKARWDWRQIRPGVLALHGFPVEVHAKLVGCLPYYRVLVNGAEYTSSNGLKLAKWHGESIAAEMREIGSV